MTATERYEKAHAALAAFKIAAEAAEAAMADLTHPFRNSATAEIDMPWADEADAAYDMVLDASHVVSGAIAKLDEARPKL